MSFDLRDSGGNLWLIGVTDVGNISAANLGAGSTANVFLNDLSGNSWQLVVSTGGNIGATSVATSANPTLIRLTSPGAIPYLLQVSTSGILFISPNFQPDEDYWSVFITQPAIPILMLFS